MIKLDQEDRVGLIRILDKLPILQNYRGRRQVLEYAGLGNLIPQLDLEGTSFVVNSELIQFLESFGRVTYQHHALGIFLNAITEFIGASDDATEFVNQILSKYELMTPSSQVQLPSAWKGSGNPEETFEKIIGENTLKHISFLQRGIEISKSVGFVVAPKWTGTGFFVSRNLFLTNNHVIPEQSILKETIIRLNYQLTFDGAEEKIVDFHPNLDGMFYTSQNCDYTIFELENHPGNDWGRIKLNPKTVSKGDRVNIIQHPAGLPKQISFQNNFVEYADGKILQYLTSTLGGSSGSPVFNDNWEIVGLHHAGGMIIEPSTNRRYFRNEGISIISILKDMPNNIKATLNN